jgi:hypothetical protein
MDEQQLVLDSNVAENKLKPLWDIENKDLDQISRTMLFVPNDDGITVRVTDGIIFFKVDLPVISCSMNQPFVLDLLTMKQIVDNSQDQVVVKKNENEFFADVLDGQVYIRAFNFDQELYDPTHGVDIDWNGTVDLDRETLVDHVNSMKVLSSRDNIPEHEYIFMGDETSYICNTYSITREQNEFGSYKLPLVLSDYILGLIRASSDESVAVKKSNDVYQISTGSLTMYHDPQEPSLDSDYKDAVNGPDTGYVLEKSHVKQVVAMAKSIPMVDEQFTLQFKQDNLKMVVHTHKGQDSQFVLSTETFGDNQADRSVNLSIENFHNLLKIFDGDEIQAGLSEYSLSLQSGNRTSIVFLT